MFGTILDRCRSVVRCLADALRRVVTQTRRGLADMWRGHRVLMNANPAYDAVVAGAAVELVRLQTTGDLLATLITAGLAVCAVIARRAGQQASRPFADGGPDWS